MKHVENREKEEMWDNNGGRNYVVTFVRDWVAASGSASNSKLPMAAIANGSAPSAGVRVVVKSVAAANQAYYAQRASLHQR